MIVDNIKNAKLYYSLHPEFKAAFECLASLTAESENKRYEINGDNCFVNLTEYENKCEAECKYEAHAKYIDIQFMVKGKEFGVFKRFVIPTLALCGSGFMIYAAIESHKTGVLYYLVVFAAFMFMGWFFDRKNKKRM